MGGMSENLAQLLGEIDVALAEHALGRRARAQQALELRAARDRAWIRVALAQIEQAASDEDIAAALEGRPGRYLPGTDAWQLVRRMRERIDEVERCSERGEWPGLRQLREHAAALGFELGIPAEELRPAFHLAEQRTHPVRRVAGFSSALYAPLANAAGAQILLHLLAAQMLLAQGYPVVWLGEGDWREWCASGREGPYVADRAFARSVRFGIALHV